eukprot:COSAG05_NODE_13920_length_414_cov_0.536508_2_plen_32_part_01
MRTCACACIDLVLGGASHTNFIAVGEITVTLS